MWPGIWNLLIGTHWVHSGYTTGDKDSPFPRIYQQLSPLAVTGHHGQKQHGEERVSFTLQLTVHHGGKSGQELKAGTWRQKLKQRPQRNDAYWLALLGLFILISYTIQDIPTCVGTTPPTVG